jgi:hypothetical protein
MKLSKFCCEVPKGRNFHNRRQAKRSLRTVTSLRLAHGAQALFRAQPTPVRHAERLNFDAVALRATCDDATCDNATCDDAMCDDAMCDDAMCDDATPSNLKF